MSEIKKNNATKINERRAEFSQSLQIKVNSSETNQLILQRKNLESQLLAGNSQQELQAQIDILDNKIKDNRQIRKNMATEIVQIADEIKLEEIGSKLKQKLKAEILRIKEELKIQVETTHSQELQKIENTGYLEATYEAKAQKLTSELFGWICRDISNFEEYIRRNKLRTGYLENSLDITQEKYIEDGLADETKKIIDLKIREISSFDNKKKKEELVISIVNSHIQVINNPDSSRDQKIIAYLFLQTITPYSSINTKDLTNTKEVLQEVDISTCFDYLFRTRGSYPTYQNFSITDRIRDNKIKSEIPNFQETVPNMNPRELLDYIKKNAVIIEKYFREQAKKMNVTEQSIDENELRKISTKEATESLQNNYQSQTNAAKNELEDLRKKLSDLEQNLANKNMELVQKETEAKKIPAKAQKLARQELPADLAEFKKSKVQDLLHESLQYYRIYIKLSAKKITIRNQNPVEYTDMSRGFGGTTTVNENGDINLEFSPVDKNSFANIRILQQNSEYVKLEITQKIEQKV